MTDGFARLGWAWQQDLAAREKIVLLALAQHASRDAGTCWPKVQTLAGECGLSPQSVRRAITELEKSSLIAAFDVLGPTGSTSNTYVLNVEGLTGYEWERVSRIRAVGLRRGRAARRSELRRNGLGLHTGRAREMTPDQR